MHHLFAYGTLKSLSLSHEIKNWWQRTCHLARKYMKKKRTLTLTWNISVMDVYQLTEEHVIQISGA